MVEYLLIISVYMIMCSIFLIETSARHGVIFDIGIVIGLIFVVVMVVSIVILTNRSVA